MSTIDLSCPAEIFRTELPTESNPAAELTLFNLSDRVITSVEAHLSLQDQNGNETERLAFRGRALNGRPHSTFLMTVPCAPGNGVERIEATVEKVWFKDNEVWRRDPAGAVEYTPNNLPVSPALTNLRFIAGETAVGYPTREGDLWICLCGRPNAAEEEYCVRCGRQRDLVFERFSPEAVAAQINLRERQLDLNSRSMREDTIRLQRIREIEFQKHKARRGSRIRLAFFLALALLLIAGAAFYGAPGLRLLAARRSLETGDFSTARATFERLGSFGNAPEMIRECDWRLALQKMDNNPSAEELAEISALFRGMPERPEALEKANEADLLRGRLLLESGDWRGAREAVSLLPEDTPGKAELIADCRLAEGRELMNHRDYEAARAVFLELEGHPEAKDLAAECLYLPAKEQMAQQNWDEAIELLSRIPDYRDSRDLALECHYNKAMALETAGDYTGASTEYLMAREWEDAPERSKNLTYWLAGDLLAKGDLKGAQSLYASIPDYLDANEKERSCRYQLAVNAYDDREFTRALELLEGIPDDYEKTGSMRAEASYQKAKLAARDGDWAAAAALLGSVDRDRLKREHRDVEDLYLQACGQAGIDPYPVTPEPEDTGAGTPSPAPAATPAPDLTPVPEADEGTPSPVPFLVTEDE